MTARQAAGRRPAARHEAWPPRAATHAGHAAWCWRSEGTVPPRTAAALYVPSHSQVHAAMRLRSAPNRSVLAVPLHLCRPQQAAIHPMRLSAASRGVFPGRLSDQERRSRTVMIRSRPAGSIITTGESYGACGREARTLTDRWRPAQRPLNAMPVE
jgi:hypothetical protein